VRRWLALGLLLGLASVASAQLSLPRGAPSPRAFSPITVLPMATRNAGNYVFTAISVPTGVVGVIVTLDVSQANDPLPSFSGIVEGTRDGTNWAAVGQFTRVAKSKGQTMSGATATTLGAAFIGGTFWNDSQNAQRQLRGGATLGGSMRFALTVTPQ
jgi:hypothetical protein